MVRIFLIRHGQTQWNREGQGRFRGRADIPLDDTGISQAHATAKKLAGCNAVAVYSSPLSRALMTAQSIADQLSLTVTPVNGLIDIDYGNWQGLSTEEALREDKDLHQLWVERPHEVIFPGGEGLKDVRDRVSSFIDWLTAKHPEQTVILVSHVVVCKVFICVVLGLDTSHFWQIGQHVCGINDIGMRNGEFVLKSLNDTCHLRFIQEFHPTS
ncbi:MAG: histidine phosphatase family protein [Chloroflexota bacterium]